MPDRSGWERRPGFQLADKRAIVYGAETESGAAIAEALAEAGADVALIAATGTANALASIAARIEAHGRKTHRAGWDASSPSAIGEGMHDLVAQFGAPRVLVTATNAPIAKPIEQITDEEYSTIIDVNLNAVFFACRAFLREFAPGTANGRIICVTNVFGQRGVDDLSAYGAAHGGVHNLVRALAQECGARDGMTVNAIATGWMTDTPGRGPDELGANRLMRFVPMRRFGEPNEAGPLAVLLAGEASGYISGQILHIDGGITTHL